MRGPTVVVATLLLLLGLTNHGTVQGQEKDCPIDVGFLVDASGSIRDTSPSFDEGRNWRLTTQFLEAVVNHTMLKITGDKKKDAQFGLVTFSLNVKTEFKLGEFQNKSYIVDAIRRINPEYSWTNTAGGLDMVTTDLFQPANGDRSGITNVLIMLTDGNPTKPVDDNDENREIAYAAAQRLKDACAFVIVVGIGPSIDEEVLIRIASDPRNLPCSPDKPMDKDKLGTTVFTSPDFEQLTSILNSIINASCQAVIPPPTCIGSDADVVFILDASGSIGSSNFQKIRKFVSDVVMELDVDSGRIRVGVEKFSDNAEREFYMNRYSKREDVIKAVDKIPYSRGTTNTADAFRFARTDMFRSNNGNRNSAKDIIVIITDGESNDQSQTLQQAQLAKKDGIHVVSVGIGDWLDEYELRAIASDPSEKNYIHVTNFDALTSVVEIIRDAVCNNVNECDSNPCQNGATCHDEVQYYWCECPPGFSGVNCEKECVKPADIVFAMDASGSIGVENFQKMIDFVAKVVHELDVDNADSNGNNGVRVGLEVFSTDANIQFHLNEYSTKTVILNGIKGVQYVGGRTRTNLAITLASDQMFQSSNGDRRQAGNHLVVITDGVSEDQTKTWDAARAARSKGINIIAVGIGSGVNIVEMEGMASAPVDKNVLLVDEFDELMELLQPTRGKRQTGGRVSLPEALCDNQNECDSNPCQNGARCTDKINGYECGPCPTGYTGIHCERRCDGRLDIALVLDSSGSIRHERWPIIIDYMATIVSEFDVSSDRVRVGMVSWSNDASMGFKLNQYQNRQDVIGALKRTRFIGGLTHTADALQMTQQEIFTDRNGDRADVPNLAFVVTDGNSNVNPEKTIPRAIDLKIAGTHVIVLAVGKTFVNMLELQGIASEPTDKTVFNVDSIKDLTPPTSMTETILKAMCDDENECNANPCRNGGRCQNKPGRYYCECNAPWAGRTCDRRCNRQLDVALLLDLSGSVEANYRMTVDFAKNIVYGLDMSFDKTRIGALAFADNIIEGDFYLNDHTEKEAVLIALTYNHRGGKTNIQLALQHTRNQFFTSSRGDRSGVQNVAILVSDFLPTMNAGTTNEEARQLRNQGVEIYSVTIPSMPGRNRADQGRANEIASDPDSSHMFELQDEQDVSAVANALLDQLCNS